jgi:nucleotidyltransferase/DNA polymerase involved in DNA repair
MKAAGVTTGMPIWDAVKLCPEGLYLKRDFRWYEVLSRQMLAAVREFSPAVEYYVSIRRPPFPSGAHPPGLP